MSARAVRDGEVEDARMREDAASTSGESSEGGGSDGEDGEEGAQGTPLPPPRPRDDPARRSILTRWVTEGAWQAVELALQQPPRYASLRNRLPIDQARLEKAAYRAPARTAPTARAAEPPPRALWPEGAPEGPIAIEMLYPERYLSEVVPWLALADAAMATLAAGGQPQAVPTLTLRQEDMPPWARGIVWDTSDPLDCRPVRRSSRHTWTADFPGPKVQPRALRRMARKLGWHDKDIVAQIGEGGFEGRSTCPLDTVLAFHHAGVVRAPKGSGAASGVGAVAGFHQVDQVVQTDIAKGWARAPVRHLPFVPCRLLPRNVVMNQKFRHLPGGGMEEYWKPRVTTDGSHPHDGASSPNDGVPKADTHIELPTPQQLAWALAVVQTAGDAAGVEVECWGLDFSDAYRYCPVQRSEWWQQCFIWTGGVVVETRGVFGAAWMPNRFQRLSNLAAAAARAEIGAFDRDVPVPPRVDAWQQARMRAGLGAEDSPARFLQNYIDDSLAASLADRVVLPPQWAHMHPKDETTRAATAATTAVGGRPSHPYSRAVVHCRIAAGVYAALGFDVSISKTQAGTKVASLGLRTAADTRRVDCPPIKAAAIREQAEAILRQIRPGGRVEFKPLERLTGRLNHIAQVAPELKPYLRYAHAALSGAGGGRKAARRQGFRRAARWIRVGQYDQPKHGRSIWLGVRKLMRMASQTIQEWSVPLAPDPTFPGPGEPGAALVHMDASRDWGAGGWAWMPDPQQSGGAALTTFEARWPPEIVEALRTEVSTMSMPAGEMFGVLLAVAMARDAGARAIIVVTDCAPVAGAVNASGSPSPQLHHLVRGVQRVANGAQVLAVHVKREHNQVADDLSKGLGPKVRAAAKAEGFGTAEWHVPEHCWRWLREAAGMPLSA